MFIYRGNYFEGRTRRIHSREVSYEKYTECTSECEDDAKGNTFSRMNKTMRHFIWIHAGKKLANEAEI